MTNHALIAALRGTVGRPMALHRDDGAGAEAWSRIVRILHAAPNAADMAVLDEAADERRMARYRPVIVPGARQGQATAVIPVHGVALYDLDFQPYAFSLVGLARTVSAFAASPEIANIVLDINTPGGQATGTPEAADAIFAARKTKNVTAIINPLAASAGYWIASQAGRIIASPSADVGSIGVFLLHLDMSGMLEQVGLTPTFIFAGPHKVEGNPFEPLSAEAREYAQGEVDQIYADFLSAVARGRGRTVAEVRDGMGGGRTMMAPAARKAGMIDAIMPLDTAFHRAGVARHDVMRLQAEAEELAPDHVPATAEADDPPAPPAAPAGTDPAANHEDPAAAAQGRRPGGRHRRLARLRAGVR